MKPLLATARLQFHKDFPLPRAIDLIPYFARLGITHLYASPLLTSRPGSRHGYDQTDPRHIDPELGGEDALRALVAGLRAHDMGLILDIVPNHMGVGGADNAWWLDVLEWGRASPYAEFFDIDWDPPDPTQRGRMLAPFLGRAYGEALAEGELVLRFDERDGRLFVDYFGNRFPINPRDYAAVLLREGGALEAPARAFGDLPPERAAMRQAAEAARGELRRPENREAIAEALALYDAKTPEGRDRLHQLLERQNFRLAWWRAASDEINWRRFFDVNQLAGLRAEVPAVFEAIHAKIFALYEEGLIDGVRVDHVDGLADPRGYCRKLRRRLEGLRAGRPEGLRDAAPVVWVEKILAPAESLPADWLTDGTTGYDFMNEAAGVLHDPEGEAEITRIWCERTGRPGDFDAEAIPARRQILRDSLSSELYNTAVALHRIARRDPATRDYTLTAIGRTLTEILAHFPVYRIYAGVGGSSASDRRAMDRALAGARRTVRAVDRPLLDLLMGWLAGEGLREVPPGTRRREWLRAMVRFQQLSAPVAAKSVEDTAFYRYGRLLSRNEVGSDPGQFALSDAAFHAACAERAKRLPRALLATATHDHKRGEDVRARLAVISEIPEAWDAALTRWTRLNAPLKRDLDGPAPDAADEIMLYETLIGAWPLDLAPDDADGMAAFRARVAAWQEKALREAKRHTGWAVPSEAYEQACQDFLAGVLDAARPAQVAADIHAFMQRIAPAGAVAGLAQALLRNTSPGVPDLYQGTEYWDFSMVDPDNRRPVDFGARQRSLDEEAPPAALLRDWRDGRVKQAVVHRALALRGRRPALFAEGQYTRLEVTGPLARHVLAYARSLGTQHAITIISRQTARILRQDYPHTDVSAWGDTAISLPRKLAALTWTDTLRDGASHAGAAQVRVAELLTELPLALLEAA